MRLAGLPPSAPPRVTNEAMLRDIKAVADKLGVCDVRRGDYTREGKYSTTNIGRRFGGWTAAKIAAGLVVIPPLVLRHPSDEDLFDNFEQLWISLGRQPRGGDVAPPLSRFRVQTYNNRFGGFRKTLAFFVAHQQKIGKMSVPRRSASTDPKVALIPHKTRRGIRAQLRYQILKRDRFCCRLCNRSPTTDASVQLHIDHIKPWSLGGESTMDNLQTLCDTCNAGKSNTI